MKKLLSGITALMMLCLCAGAALAGEGDRMIVMSDADSRYTYQNVRYPSLAGEKLYLFLNGNAWSLMEYDLATGESVSWDMSEIQDQMNGLAGDTVPEEPEDDGENIRESLSASENIESIFVWQGELYALTESSRYYGEEGNRLDGGHVRKVELADGKASLAEEDTVTLVWSGMTETSGSWTSSRYISSSVAGGDRLCLCTYDDDGNSALVVYDLTTGAFTEQMIQNLNEVGLTPDGRFLICQYAWGEQEEKIYSVYDPESESLEALIRFDTAAGEPTNFAWNPETDTIYYTLNGEIYRAPGRDPAQGEPANDAPVSSGAFALLTEGEQLVIWSSQGAYLRNTDPAKRSAVTLRIRPFSWSSNMENTANQFTAEHSDVSIIRENYGDETSLLSGMMNQDSSVDIFLIDSNSNAWNAVYNRGFTADLSGDALLTEKTGKMYPWARETVERDGKLTAIPLSLSGSSMGYSPEALKKLGMTKEELPKTWDELLDFLETLPEKVAGTEVRPFDMYTDKNDLIRYMTETVLTQYSTAYEDGAFQTPLLQRLLDRIQKLNGDALELLSQEELDTIEDYATYQAMGGDRTGLFSQYASFGIDNYSWNVPMPLALDETGPVAPVNMTVAFINPYSVHPAESMLFLDTLLARQDLVASYMLDPSLNEAVRYPNHEENRKSMEKWLEQAKKTLEKAQAAEDEEQIESWTEIVNIYEKELADYDETNWLISPEAIEQYRSFAEHMKCQTWDFYSALNSGEDGEQYYQLMQSFTEGNASSAELLSYIDRKVQMMRLEGN